jgi:tetratricopeptide (TPR) repeat protein
LDYSTFTSVIESRLIGYVLRDIRSIVVHASLFRSLCFHYLTKRKMKNEIIKQCILLNNIATDFFEKGLFKQSASHFKEALDAIHQSISASSLELASSRSCKQSWSCWSNYARFQPDVKNDVFVHFRAIFLTSHPRSIELSEVSYQYASAILYNLAVCYHAMSMVEKATREIQFFLNKALVLYNMALNVMEQSPVTKDAVLLTALYNNTGHILHLQGRLTEASQRLKAIQNLMPFLPVDAFDPDDLYGMFLNSLLEANVASAA